MSKIKKDDNFYLIDGSGWRISPDDFANTLIQTNSKGIIAVNASYAIYGTAPNPIEVAAGYAADFVRHMNNDLNANIKYWEVGNENYGPWQAGYSVNGNQITGSDYGTIFNVFVDSMKAADPSIKLLVWEWATHFEKEVSWVVIHGWSHHE